MKSCYLKIILYSCFFINITILTSNGSATNFASSHQAGAGAAATNASAERLFRITSNAALFASKVQNLNTQGRSQKTSAISFPEEDMDKTNTHNIDESNNQEDSSPRRRRRATELFESSDRLKEAAQKATTSTTSLSRQPRIIKQTQNTASEQFLPSPTSNSASMSTSTSLSKSLRCQTIFDEDDLLPKLTPQQISSETKRYSKSIPSTEDNSLRRFRAFESQRSSNATEAEATYAALAFNSQSSPQDSSLPMTDSPRNTKASPTQPPSPTTELNIEENINWWQQIKNNLANCKEELSAGGLAVAAYLLYTWNTKESDLNKMRRNGMVDAAALGSGMAWGVGKGVLAFSGVAFGYNLLRKWFCGGLESRLNNAESSLKSLIEQHNKAIKDLHTIFDNIDPKKTRAEITELFRVATKHAEVLKDNQADALKIAEAVQENAEVVNEINDDLNILEEDFRITSKTLLELIDLPKMKDFLQLK